MIIVFVVNNLRLNLDDIHLAYLLFDYSRLHVYIAVLCLRSP